VTSSVVLIITFMFATPLPGADHYLAGREAERLGEHGAAVEAYAACAGQEGPLRPYAQLRAALCAAAGDTAKGIAELQQFLESHPNGPWANMAKAHLANLLRHDNKHAESAKLFAELLALEPRLWWFDRLEWQAADNLLETEERREEAYAFFRKTVETAPFRAQRLDAARRLAKSPEPDDRFTAALAMVRAEEFEEAAKVLVEAAAAMLKGDESSSPWNDLVELIAKAAGKRSTQPEPAEDTWSDGTIARLWLAYVVRLHVRNRDLEAAAAACDRLVEAYPGAEESGDALWRLAFLYIIKDEEPKALKQYLRLVEQCPDHALAVAARMRAAHLRRRLGETDKAIKAFTAVAEKGPATAQYAEALYWRGVLHETAGRLDDAKADFERAAKQGLGDYYAHRALGRCAPADQSSIAVAFHVNGTAPALRTVDIESAPLDEFPESLRAEPWFERVNFFAAHGLEEAEWEALHLAPLMNKGAEAEPIYQALGEAGVAFTAIEYAKAFDWGLNSATATPERLRVFYPRGYWPHVCAIAKETGLDPHLLLAVALQESHFRPGLTSSAGANGVMQVMPATARWLATAEPAVKGEDAARLDHPLVSLRFGAYYLMRMLERSNGNLVRALASYNAGPGNVSKWLERFPDLDEDAFIEAIPFRETREYVKAVLANYAAYKSLYPL